MYNTTYIDTHSSEERPYGVNNIFYCFFLFIIIKKCFNIPDVITSILCFKLNYIKYIE